MQRNSRASSIAIAVTAIISIQLGASLAKSLFPLIGGQGAATLRNAFGAMFLFIVWRPWRGGPLTRKTLLLILAYGVSLGAMNLLFYIALEHIPLGLAVALEFTGPLSVAFISSRRPLDFVWATLAVLGILLILPLTEAATNLNAVGAAYALGAGFCWALYIVFGQRAGSTMAAGRASALGMAVATLVTLPSGVSRAGAMLVSPKVLPLALLLAVLSSALPYNLEMVALKRLPAKTFGILMSLEPAVAALSGLVFLGEQLSFQQWAAIACVMSASFGSAYFTR